MTALQLLFVYLPVMNRLFATAPVSRVSWLEESGKHYWYGYQVVSFKLITCPRIRVSWLEVSGIALAVYLIVEAEKWWRRRQGDGGGAGQSART